jgi:hypothetical protein
MVKQKLHVCIYSNYELPRTVIATALLISKRLLTIINRRIAYEEFEENSSFIGGSCRSTGISSGNCISSANQLYRDSGN